MAAYDYRVEYLESTGTQYINTGILYNNAMTFDTSIAKTVDGNTVFWGARSGGTFVSEYMQCYLNSNTLPSASPYSRLLNLYSTNADNHAENWSSGIELELGRMYSFSGITVAAGLQPALYEITLFAFNNIGAINTSAGSCRIASFVAFQNGVKIIDLIPVVNDGVPCMYDKVSRNFFYNQGTGSFVAGPRIYEPVTGLPITFSPFGLGWMPLPYDAEIEYLESTGTQYIDTGVTPNESIIFRERIYLTEEIVTGNFFIFGSRQGAGIYGPTNFVCIWSKEGTNQGIRPDLVLSSVPSGLIFVNGTETERDFSFAVTPTVFSVNDITVPIQQAKTETNYKIFIFGANSGGSPTLSKQRVSSCSISKNGTLVRDFIPVRVGSVGYMYDRVSGELFGNAGTGSFTLGPDKN